MSAPVDADAVHKACVLLGTLQDGDALKENDLQLLVSAAVRLYANRAAKRDAPPPAFPADAVTATDAMVTTTAILKAANLQVFELGMWQAWAGR